MEQVVKISKSILKQIPKEPLTLGRVFTACCFELDDNNIIQFWGNYKTSLIKSTGLSTLTVKRNLTRLVAEGLITKLNSIQYSIDKKHVVKGWVRTSKL